MVDFRRWLLALAVVGLLLGVGSSAAYAQVGANSLTCAASAVPNIIRAEGVTELLGDIILNCTGGIPTAAGKPIPLQNVVITVGGTNVTSRITGSTIPGSPTYNISEGLLLIDEPYPTVAFPTGAASTVTNPAIGQLACQAVNNTNCAINSLGVGVGAAGSYNGSPSTAGTPHYNVFQGTQLGANSIAWSGVPIDAPGTAGTRIIRITNVRANASTLGVASTLIPTQIFESISVNGTNYILVTQGSNGSYVGNVVKGLIQSSAPPALYQQCNSVNTYLTSPPGFVTTDSGIAVSATEGFAFSFKPQNVAQTISATTLGAYLPPGVTLDPQDVPGHAYATESGFSPDTPLVANSQAEFPGYADRGTQIQFSVAGVGTGVTLYAPSYVYLTGAYGAGTVVGVAVLVSQGGAVVNAATPPLVLSGGAAANGPEVALTTVGTSVNMVYEIYYSDPSVLETMAVPISVEYVSNTGSGIPAVTTTPATVAVGFSPLSTVPTASSTAPIPRFIPGNTGVSLYSITPCSCNLLFPFVTNIAGFDTGVAIANTSVDPFGTSAQTGTVTLNYYGTTAGGGAAPPAATTTSLVPGGQEVIFTVSNGGNFGIPATPGFEGYIIAQANFQYCHGYAFISTVGAQGVANGYLAISLDIPGLNRTFNTGENEGH